jgi:DNA repair photolyase
LIFITKLKYVEFKNDRAEIILQLRRSEMPIYAPKGPALEYAPLALNYYKGCGHNCKYCYVPGFLEMIGGKKKDSSTLGLIGPTDATFEEKKKIFFRKLTNKAKRMKNDKRRVLLSFTSDPYQPLEQEWRITRQVLEILGENNIKVTILTKNPSLAILSDYNLIKKYETELATTIVWASEAQRKIWEPNASSIADRVDAIWQVHKNGLSTWVSIEPIMDEKEALDVVDMLCGKTGKLKIGVVDPRWNPEIHKSIKWMDLLLKILQKVTAAKQRYYIKNKFWDYADANIKAKFTKEG